MTTGQERYVGRAAGADVLGVVGSGLIGGSVVRRALVEGVEVVVHDTDPATARAAAAAGATLADDPADLAELADIVVIAVSPSATPEVWRELAAACDRRRRDRRLLVVDVASTKAPILDGLVDPYGGRAWAVDKAAFVLTHPMAGREHSGWLASVADLYDRAAWLVCPHEQITGDDLARIVRAVRTFGARPVLFDAGRHDRFAALVSHLPHLIAFCFRDLLEELDPAGTWYRFSGGSLADMLRVADADPALWTQILAANARELAWAREALVTRMAAGWQAQNSAGVARPVAPMFVPGPPAGSEPSRSTNADADIEDVHDLRLPRGQALGAQAGSLAATGHDGYEVVGLDDGDEHSVGLTLGRARRADQRTA